MPLWGLSTSKAGIMAGAYSLGYMASVPVLMTLTDRIDALIVLLAGSIVMGAATVAFGRFASGLLSASLLWCLAGIGCAVAYMSRLRAMTDRLGAGDHLRSITLYSARFSLGVALSFLASQVIADGHGWRMAFAVTGIAPIVMVGVCLLMKPAWPLRREQRLLDFRPVQRVATETTDLIQEFIHLLKVLAFLLHCDVARPAASQGLGEALDYAGFPILVTTRKGFVLFRPFHHILTR